MTSKHTFFANARVLACRKAYTETSDRRSALALRRTNYEVLLISSALNGVKAPSK